MPETLSNSGSARPLLDIASYARRGSGDRLSLEEIQLIERTVRRTPEVMVKVLSRGGQGAKSVGRHFAYLSRKGDLEIETDDGRKIEGKGAEAELLEDWDLDIQEQRPTSVLRAKADRKPPKLVHKVLFSMPPGTPPKKVLEAVRVFAREEFGLKHRYAMVLHTDEPHPHVHVVVKAVSEQGVRLNIRKTTLKGWRSEFARRLREQRVEANATERAARAKYNKTKSDGVYRASLAHGSQLRSPHLNIGPTATVKGVETSVAIHREVKRGWTALADLLGSQNQILLAGSVRTFIRNTIGASAGRRANGKPELFEPHGLALGHEPRVR